MSNFVSLGDALADGEVFTDGDWVESKDQNPYGEVRLTQLADIGDGMWLNKSSRFMTSEKAAKLRCTYLKPGDVLIARMPDPLGRCCIFPGDNKPCVTVVDVCIARPNPQRVDARYLMHAINSTGGRNAIAGYATGTTRQRISRKNLSMVQIPLPPLSEQKRIAAILDAADALRAKRRESIAQLDTLLQATFLDMFGDPVTNPMGWPLERVGIVAERVTKGESPKWQGHEYQDDGVLFVTSENVRDGWLDVSHPKFVPAAFNEKIARSQLRKNDILINLVGASIGRSCLFPGCSKLANVNQAVGVISLRSNVEPIYFAGLLNTPGGKEMLLGNRVEAARANISLTNLREMSIPIPATKVQRRFKEIANAVEKQKLVLNSHCDELQSLFASLQSRAFSGQL